MILQMTLTVASKRSKQMALAVISKGDQVVEEQKAREIEEKATLRRNR